MRSRNNKRAPLTPQTEPEAVIEQLSRLVSFHELEDWQKDNHHIHTGYVRSSNSFKSVARSLFYLHNESVNIYTHLWPSVLSALFSLFLYDMYFPVYPKTVDADHYAFFVFALSCVTCLGLSATFHLCKSHSRRIFAFGNKLDYLGICVLIGGSMVAILHFCLDDHQQLRMLFTLLTLAFGIGCACVSLIDKFRTPPWRKFRARMFVSYGLTGLLPILTSFYFFGYEETWARSGLKYMLWEAFFYIFGAALYGTLFPERFFPGKFDIWGHSHQLFHIMVLFGAVAHLKALLFAYEASVARRSSIPYV